MRSLIALFLLVMSSTSLAGDFFFSVGMGSGTIQNDTLQFQRVSQELVIDKPIEETALVMNFGYILDFNWAIVSQYTKFSPSKGFSYQTILMSTSHQYESFRYDVNYDLFSVMMRYQLPVTKLFHLETDVGAVYLKSKAEVSWTYVEHSVTHHPQGYTVGNVVTQTRQNLSIKADELGWTASGFVVLSDDNISFRLGVQYYSPFKILTPSLGVQMTF